MNETKKLYSSPQITRAYLLIEVLAGHELDPLEAKDIKRLTGWNGVTVTRQCQAAVTAGVAEQTPDGRWRLAVGKITNIAIAVQHGVQRARNHFDNQATNITRSTY